ncbi:MAG TPA: translation initiation factor IF-2, partial [Pyrinomonadaceae bacterium]|nr:translation initiation factor IF-2 [Pyrinomonadaceae bacterium]
MPAGKKIRIYDLAREVKQDTKRVMEDLRREGADVSVPSNSVSAELADKVRLKYFPKADPAPKRAIKVIKAAVKKKAPRPAEVEAESVEAPVEEPVEVPEVESAQPAAKPEKAPAKTAASASVRKVLKKRAPVIEEEIPEEEPIEIPAEIAEPEESVEDAPAEVEAEAVEEDKPADKASGTQIKKLTLTSAALKKGVKPGERVVSEQPTKTGKLSEEARGRDARGRRPEFRGTPGETSTPQMNYTPPADNRRKPGRSGGRRGKPGDRTGRFAEREQDLPRQRTIEERVLAQVAHTEGADTKHIRLVEGATVREFSEALGIAPRDIVQLLVKRGVFATLNQPMGDKMATDLGVDLGYNIAFVPFEEMVIEQEFEELIAAEADDVEETRAPVITVMGHVDHGKTSLLDAIRSENVAEGEAGGITQHIGAYSVKVPNSEDPDNPRRVVFLDTPGHEAFTMMRARGAKATDIVILVVAADDGVMPQTIEAVEHSKAAKVPMIVAINKIDKPDANPDRVKQGLSGLGVQPLDWGGDVEMVPVSAKNREGLDTLLETVLLQADILDLKASPTRRASGVVLEAKLDKGRGAVATALVQQGTLRVGDPFIVGQFYGKVRAMFSDRGEQVTEAAPATPVEVLGLQGVPQAGDTFQVVSDIDRAQTIASQRQMHARAAAMLKTTKRGIESLGQAEVKELLI